MIAEKLVEGIKVYYRPEEGDEAIFKEVVEGAAYRRSSASFDVEAGEHWLDLGANVGAFAVYCRLRKATAVCYEPEPGCFKLLKKNAPKFELHNAAVTGFKEASLDFFGSNRPTHARGTVSAVRGYVGLGQVDNVYGGTLIGQPVDGIKMDIEGSEGLLIDKWLLPKCKKLVMEYHTSRDPSVENLKRRLSILQRKFKQVAYPPEYDRAIESGAEEYRSHFDRMVYCWEPRK